MNYTFENFIAIESNIETKQKAIEFSLSNELNKIIVINGAIGSGKTHLAKAILNEIQNRFPTETVFYSSLEQIHHWIRQGKSIDAQFFNKNSANLIDSYTNDHWIEDSKVLFSKLSEVRSKMIITSIDDILLNEMHTKIHLLPSTQLDKVSIIENISLSNGFQNILTSDIISFLSETQFRNNRIMLNFISTIIAKSNLTATKLDLPYVKSLYIIFKKNVVF